MSLNIRMVLGLGSSIIGAVRAARERDKQCSAFLNGLSEHPSTLRMKRAEEMAQTLPCSAEDVYMALLMTQDDEHRALAEIHRRLMF